MIFHFENTLIKLIMRNAYVLCFAMHINASRAVNLPPGGQGQAEQVISVSPGRCFAAQFPQSMEVRAGGRAAAAPSAFLRTRYHRYNFSLVVLVNSLLAL